VIVRLSAGGEKLSSVRVANDPLAMAAANPQGLDWGQRRVKNDECDAIDLAHMLRLGRLPEAWIAPPATRELRELVRYRAKLDGSDTAWREPVIGMTPAARGAVD
jgi:hypothetical protein